MQLSTHPVSQEELMAYLDGQLVVERASSVAAHLERCRDCQALAADFQSVSRYLLEWQVEPKSSQPDQRITEALTSESVSKVRRLRTCFPTSRWSWAIGIAAVIVLITVITPRRYTVHQQVASKQFTPAFSPSEDAAIGGSAGLIPARGRPVAPPPRYAIIPSAPMIVRTAELTVSTGDFERTRSDMERILAENHGYTAHLTVTSPQNEGRTLDATLRLPAARLDTVLGELKKLGRVQAEVQGAEEVTQQYVDIDARLSNLRVTEQRLTDILRQRTGKLADVLAVEEQVDNVRGEIERVEAEQKILSKQIALATLSLKLIEEYKAPLRVEDSSTLTRIRNAAVEGYRALADMIINIFLFLLSSGPVLLLIGAVLFLPARILWRKMLERRATSSNPQ